MSASLFDPAALSMRASRAARLWPSGAFLHARAADGIAERLGDVARSFPRAAVIGAGGGLLPAALAGRPEAVETIAMDLAPMAALCGAEAGVEPLRLGEGRFDLAASSLWLHRCDDPVGQLIQMRRLLRPDGLLIAALFGGRTLHELRAALAEAEAAEEGGLSPRVAPMADVRDLGGLLQRAGFAMPVADVERIEVDYANPVALMRDLRAMGEANAMTDRRRTFTRRGTLQRAAAVYAAHFARPDGRIRATFEIVYLTGWSPGPDQPTPKRPGSATARLAEALGTVERKPG